MPEISFLVAYTLLGSVAGLMAGLLGVGGGLIIVPALIFLFSAQGFDYSVVTHAAIGSSLASIIATGLSSARAHHQRQAVNWPVVKRLTTGLLLGSFAGAWVADSLDTRMLQWVFGCFAVLVSAQMFFSIKAVSEKKLPGVFVMNVAGGLIGLVSGVVGIGGGSMTVPYLTWHHVDIRRAVATSSACGVPIAVAGFIGFLWAGLDATDMPAGSSGFIYWPAVLMISVCSILFAPVGAKLAHELSVRHLKRIFAVILFLVGLKLILA